MSHYRKTRWGLAAPDPWDLARFPDGRPTVVFERPHFRVSRRRDKVHSPHEQAVLDAGYPWVRTNVLIPTWQSLDKDSRSNGVPDRLNSHGHHGVNTHLIVEGDLTLIKHKKMFNQNHVAAITISTRADTYKELSVAADEIYSGESQQGCTFVEGHRSLSPRSAHRYMSRGSLDFCDQYRKPFYGANRDYVLEQLESAVFQTKFDFKVGRRVAETCTFKDDSVVTRAMSHWFFREWNDPDVQAAKGEDISEGLIKAFNEWLPGRLEEI